MSRCLCEGFGSHQPPAHCHQPGASNYIHESGRRTLTYRFRPANTQLIQIEASNSGSGQDKQRTLDTHNTTLAAKCVREGGWEENLEPQLKFDSYCAFIFQFVSICADNEIQEFQVEILFEHFSTWGATAMAAVQLRL